MTQTQTILRRHSEGYNPLFLDGLELKNIHFFDTNGIKFSTGHGWFSVIKGLGLIEGEQRWQYSQSNPTINIGAMCFRKRKPDFKSKEPFYIRVPREDYQDKTRKCADLYLPFDSSEWTTIKEFSMSQYEDRQLIDDLYANEHLGIGVTVPGGERIVSKAQATKEKIGDLTQGMDPELANIVNLYTQRATDYDNTKRHLESQQENIKQQLASLKCPSWIDDMVKPIGEAMLRTPELADRVMEIFGPFGIGARTSIHFYRKDIADVDRFKGDNCLSIKFEPGDLDSGELYLVDENINTKKFKEGTIGEINGMNNPVTPMPKSIKSLVQWLIHQHNK